MFDMLRYVTVVRTAARPWN